MMVDETVAVLRAFAVRETKEAVVFILLATEWVVLVVIGVVVMAGGWGSSYDNVGDGGGGGAQAFYTFRRLANAAAAFLRLFRGTE